MAIKDNRVWFKRIRSSYLPTSTVGFILYFIYLAYLLALIADWLRDGHHVWYFLVDVLPLSVAAALITQYIASKHSK
jgi:biotin transporter BioY